MKKASRIALALMLSCLVLVSGSGLIVGKMVCLRSGHVVVVPQEVTDCCSTTSDCCEDEAAPDFAFEGKCCDVQNFAFDAGDFTPASDLSVKAPAPLTLFFLPGNFHRDVFSPARTAWNAHPPDPLIAGTGALPFLRVFRI